MGDEEATDDKRTDDSNRPQESDSYMPVKVGYLKFKSRGCNPARFAFFSDASLGIGTEGTAAAVIGDDGKLTCAKMLNYVGLETPNLLFRVSQSMTVTSEWNFMKSEEWQARVGLCRSTASHWKNFKKSTAVETKSETKSSIADVVDLRKKTQLGKQLAASRQLGEHGILDNTGDTPAGVGGRSAAAKTTDDASEAQAESLAQEATDSEQKTSLDQATNAGGATESTTDTGAGTGQNDATEMKTKGAIPNEDHQPTTAKDPNGATAEKTSTTRKKSSKSDSGKKGGSGSNNMSGVSDAELKHWRTVVDERMRAALKQTATACVEANAYFLISEMGCDTIGHYIREEADDQRNVLLAVGSETINACVREMMRNAPPSGHHVVEIDDSFLPYPRTTTAAEFAKCCKKSTEYVGKYKDKPDDNHALLLKNHSIVKSASKTRQKVIEEQLSFLEKKPDKYYYQLPTSAATHIIVAESKAGVTKLRDLLERSVMMGELTVNGGRDSVVSFRKAAQLARPCFIFKHTGGAADLLAYTIEEYLRRHVPLEGKEAIERDNAVRNERDNAVPFSFDEDLNRDFVKRSDVFRDCFCGPLFNKADKEVEMMEKCNEIYTTLDYQELQSSQQFWLKLIGTLGINAADQTHMHEKLTSVMSAMNDYKPSSEMQADAERLTLVWQMHASISDDLNFTEKMSDALSFLALLTTQVCALPPHPSATPRSPLEKDFLHAMQKSKMLAVWSTLPESIHRYNTSDPLDAASNGFFEFFTIALPLVGALALSIDSLLIPRVRANATRSARSRLEREIYCFRTRVGDYNSRALARGESKKAGSTRPGAKTKSGGGGMNGEIGAADSSDSPRKLFATKVDAVWLELGNTVRNYSLARGRRIPTEKEPIEVALEKVNRLISESHRNKARILPYWRSKAKRSQNETHLMLPPAHITPKPPTRDARVVPDESVDADDKPVFVTLSNEIESRTRFYERRQHTATEDHTQEARLDEDVSRSMVHELMWSYNTDTGRSVYGERNEDDGVSPLSASGYISMRLVPQVYFFSQEAPRLKNRLNAIQMVTIFLTTLCSALAVVGGGSKLAVPGVLAVSSALTSWCEFKAYGSTNLMMNASRVNLERLLVWWQCLSLIEKRRPDNKERLILLSENYIMQAYPELTGSTVEEGVEDEYE